MVKKGADSEATSVLQELEDIKRLLLFALLKSGASQAEVANALGVSQPSVSRMFPGRTAKPKAASRKMRVNSNGATS